MKHDGNSVATGISRRTVLQRGAITGAAVLLGTAVSGTAAADQGGRAAEFDPTLIDVVNVFDAPEPTLRIDNYNATAAMVRIHSTGASDGMVYTVGAGQGGYRGKEDGNPNAVGKYVSAECGEVITDVDAKRPQDKDWQSVPFGTATVGGAGCP